tara:strand:- start:3527 stop:4453 length:927 start_codon:yes stop_codon:yes gene_type:complete
MPIPMDITAQQRALRAIALMVQQGYGIMNAAELANSSRRSIHKYMKYAGMKFTIRKGKMRIVKTMQQKIYEFVLGMSRGDSATRAARNAHTTIRTMARKEIAGTPLIKKDNGTWKLQVYPLYNHSLILYGHIIGLGDGIQGQFEEKGEIESPDAPSIWWQIDFDEFISTLSDVEVGDFWTPEIMEWLRGEMQMPLVLNDVLAERFLSNEDVFDHADEHGRILDGNLKVTRLENIMNRYDVTMHSYVNYGVDDNHPDREREWIANSDLGDVISIGKFQVFYVDEEAKAYPQNGPLTLEFEYNLRIERES